MCGQFIARTYMRIGSALCEMCRRVENGEPITEDLIKSYEIGKLGRENVSMLVLKDETPKALGKFSLRSMGGDIMHVLGLKKIPKDKDLKSAEIAKSKRRGRLFQNVQLGEKEDTNKQE